MERRRSSLSLRLRGRPDCHCPSWTARDFDSLSSRDLFLCHVTPIIVRSSKQDPLNNNTNTNKTPTKHTAPRNHGAPRTRRPECRQNELQPQRACAPPPLLLSSVRPFLTSCQQLTANPPTPTHTHSVATPLCARRRADTLTGDGSGSRRDPDRLCAERGI